MWLKIAIGAIVIFTAFATFVIGICVIAASDNCKITEAWRRNENEHPDREETSHFQ